MLDTNEDFTYCLKKAYSKALGPKHSFVVRAGAKLAMSFAPSNRKTPMKYFIGKD